jgi:hypothetical protein
LDEQQQPTRTPRTIRQAWEGLAAAVLYAAIKDARQKDKKARLWLLSEAAQLMFDASTDLEIDIKKWVKAGCPVLDK